MVCNKTDELIMKYMDKVITNKELTELETHIENCKNCKEEFEAYKELMEGFNEVEIIEAPNNFEFEVMKKILELPEVRANVTSKLEDFVCFLWGFVSLFTGVSVILMINKEQIFSYFASKPELSVFYNIMVPIESYVTRFTTNIIATGSGILEGLTVYLDGLRYILIVAFAILAVIQYLIYKKDKVKV